MFERRDLFLRTHQHAHCGSAALEAAADDAVPALALFLLWLYVNGVYWAHWSWQNPEGLAQMREANAFASTFLYLLCGMIWLHHDPLYEVLVQR